MFLPIEILRDYVFVLKTDSEPSTEFVVFEKPGRAPIDFIDDFIFAELLLENY